MAVALVLGLLSGVLVRSEVAAGAWRIPDGELAEVAVPSWSSWLEHQRNVSLGYTGAEPLGEAEYAGPDSAVGDGGGYVDDTPVGSAQRGPNAAPGRVVPDIRDGEIDESKAPKPIEVKSDPSTWVEVPEGRGAFESMYVTPEGATMVDVSSFPLNFQDEKGVWQRIDNSVRQGADGVLTNTANEWSVSFDVMSKGRGVLISTPDGDIRFVAEGARGVEPTVEPDGVSVRYAEVFPGSDLVYRVHGGGIEEYLVVKHAGATTEVSFAVDGLTFDVTAAGLEARGDSALAKRVRFSSPETFDGKGRPIGHDNQVFKSSVGADGRSRVTVGVRSTFAKNLPADSFPLVVDPSAWVSPATSWVQSFGVYTSNGSAYATYNDGYARVGNPYLSAGSTVRYRSAVQFEYSQWLGASVLNANLWTTVSSGSGAGAQPLQAFWASQVGFHHATHPLLFASTNPPAPGYSSVAANWYYPYLSSSINSGTVAHQSAGLANLYNNWTRLNINGGVLLLKGNEASAYTYKKFAVSLQLQVNRPTSTPTLVSSASGRSTTWGAAVDGTDPDGDVVYYRHELLDGSTVVFDNNWVSSRSYTYQVPQTLAGKTLTYRVSQWDWVTWNGETRVKTVSGGSWTVPNSPPAGVAPSTALPVDESLVPNLTPTLQVAGVTDPDGDNVEYQFRLCPTNTWNPATCYESPKSPSLSLLAQWSGIKWGRPVWWGVVAWDSVSSTVVFPVASFVPARTPVTKPELGFGVQPNMRPVADVNPGSGNLTYAATDLSVEAMARPLQWLRTYNSASTVVGAFGPGWTSSWDFRLTDETSNLAMPGVSVRLLDGAVLWFGYNAVDGSFSPAFGDGTTLSSSFTAPAGVTGAVWAMTDPEGTVYYFNSAGVFVGLNDRAGRVVTVSTAGLVQTFTDVDSGRQMFVEWDGTPGATASRVVAVRTVPMAAYGNTPIEWRYYYNSGRLEKACDPRNNSSSGLCTVYSYDGSSRLLSVVLPRGNTQIGVTYHSDGKVATRADGLSNVWAFAYGPPGAGEPGVSKTTVTDPRGNVDEFFYDEALREFRHRPGDGPESVLDFAIDGFIKALTQVLDPNSTVNPTFEFTFDPDGDPRTVEDPSGAVTEAEYDEATDQLVWSNSPNSSEVTITLDPMVGGGVPEIIETVGQPTTTVEYTTGTEVAPGGGTQPEAMPSSVSTSDGLSADLVYSAAGDLLSYTTNTGVVYTYTYDEIGRQLSETVTWGSDTATTTISYTKMGQESSLTQPRVQNPVTGQWHQVRVTTLYDANTNPFSVTLSDIEPPAPGFSTEPDRTMTSEYDLNDRAWRITDPEGAVTSVVFDAVGNVTSQTDALGRVTTTAYDTANRPTVTTLLGYVDPTNPGPPTNVVLSSVTYDSVGRIATQTDASGAVVENTYDTTGRVTKRTLKGFVPPSGPPVDVILDEYLYVDETLDRVKVHQAWNGLIRSTYGYTPSGALATERLHNGVPGFVSPDRVTTYEYDALGRLTVERLETDPASQVLETRTSYDAFGRVASETVENGAVDLVTTMVYDQMNRLVGTTDPNGAMTTNEYDVLGRMVRSFEAPRPVVAFGATPSTASPTSVIGYGAFGDVIQLQQPGGASVSYTYDRNGRQLTKTLPTYVQPFTGTSITPVTSIEYDDAGNIVARVDARGQQTDFVYDTLNRVAITTEPAPTVGGARPTTMARFDVAGNLVWRQGPTGAVSTATYDLLGRMTSSSDVVRNGTASPDVFTTSYTYNWAGQMTQMTDPDGRVSSQVWSPAGEVLATTDGGGHTSTTLYNSRGQVLRTTDPMGRSTRNTYDLAGRLTHSGAFTDTGTELVGSSFTYDLNGNLLTKAGLTGPPTTYTYDVANQLTSVQQPVATGHTITTSFGYDISGQPTKTVDGNNHEWWTTYNVWGFEESRIEPATSAHPTLADRTFTFAYDAAGAVARTQQPGGVSMLNTFDLLGRLTSQVGGGGDTQSFEYDLAGRPTTLWSGGTSLTFGYNDRGQLTTATGSAGTSSFTYSASGALTARTDSVGTTQYNWNNRGLLNSLVDPLTGTSHAYSYNPAGQLTTDTMVTGADTVVRTLTHDGIGRVATDTTGPNGGPATTTLAYTYDTLGNLTTKTVGPAARAGAGTNSYTYDWAGRLTSWTNPGATTLAYTYDDNGNLTGNGPVASTFDERNRMLTNGATALTWSPRGTISTFGGDSYTYDTFGRLTQAGGIDYTYDALGRVVSRDAVAFTYAGASMDPSNDGTTSTVFTPGGVAVSNGVTGTAALVVADRHGDVTDLIDTDGTSVTARVFDPWGAPVTGAVTGIGFQGDFTDPDTGLVNMGARWYSPELGGFMSRDTYAGRMGNPATMNRYGYANSSPMDHTDPDGRCAVRYDRGACSSKHTSKVANTAYRLSAAKPSVRKLVDTNMAHESRAQQTRAGWTPPATKSRATVAKAVASNVTKYQRFEQQPPPKPTATFASCELNDSCVMGANSSIGKLSREWDQCLLSTDCGAEELVNAISRSKLTGLGLGGLVFALIDVSRQGNWDKSDGNWSSNDVDAAAAGTNLAKLLSGKGLSDAAVTALTELVSSVATRLVDHNDLYEKLDRDPPGWFEQALDWVGDNFLTVVSVGLTLAALFTPCTVACAVASAAVSGIDAVQTCAETGVSFNCAVSVGGAVLDAYGAGAAFTVASKAASVGGKALSVACSFSGDTEVVMADGTRKRIDEVEVGDLVLATDPETGETKARMVVATLPHTDQLVTLNTDAGQVVTTEDHQYWNVTDREWQAAQDLDPGDQLHTPDDTTVTVEGLDWTTLHQATAYDLDVQGIDTFYVTAGHTAVLVHNCNITKAASVFEGGVYDDLSTNGGLFDRHHMPAKNGVPEPNGPAIQMERADHRLTASYGSSAEAKAYRAKQQELIALGRRDDAIQMDIDDVTSLFPGKYDGAILQMIDRM